MSTLKARLDRLQSTAADDTPTYAEVEAIRASVYEKLRRFIAEHPPEPVELTPEEEHAARLELRAMLQERAAGGHTDRRGGRP